MLAPSRLQAQSREWVKGFGDWEEMASLTEANHREQEPVKQSGGSWGVLQSPGSLDGQRRCLACSVDSSAVCVVTTEHTAQLLRAVGLRRATRSPSAQGGGKLYTHWSLTASVAAC